MSEFSFSSTTKKTCFSSRLLSDVLHCCFFMFSHPLYFSYFIFFSPYLFKLFSFLSPLFVTTTLLLLALLTAVSPSVVQDNSPSELSESKMGFLAASYQTVLERLRSKFYGCGDEEEFQRFEELDVYKIVFESSTFEIREDPVEIMELVVKKTCSEATEAPVDKHLTHELGNAVCAAEDRICKLKQSPVEISGVVEIERSKGSLEEQIEFEDIPCEKEDRKVKPEVEESDKVEEPKEILFMRSESKEIMGNKIKGDKVNDESGEGYYTPKGMVSSPRFRENFTGSYGGLEYSTKAMENSQTLASNLGSFGSMRKEKEWRRTLACKLFEERHNGDGGEGMDMLWETYETESNRAALTKSNTKKGKKGGVLDYNDDDEDDIDDGDGQLCCLQALKFSAGKMNLGMGRPNLMKISKAFKGIGWLHHVSRGKKVQH